MAEKGQDQELTSKLTRNVAQVRLLTKDAASINREKRRQMQRRKNKGTTPGKILTSPKPPYATQKMVGPSSAGQATGGVSGRPNSGMVTG